MIKDIIVFDLDGTLSIVGDRLKYLKENDWDSFYLACGEDSLNIPVSEIYRMVRISPYKIKIVTGRRESVRGVTYKWMHENGLGIYIDNLYMRKDGDKRHDTEVKPELIEPFKDRILMIFEDRASMVKKWREIGLVCFQVAEGDF